MLPLTSGLGGRGTNDFNGNKAGTVADTSENCDVSIDHDSIS